ncbi:uncharacterized protein LOC120286983 [Eucalyptus grandis]|uniref:uncharacterized protein LOC120286983 n=1 Tax=Eucalyptus grandis TaxID=71139 RepID=UPI00192ED59E|nr:uncharacterized protein LOC120286983 [Eucalyptus grandis]
MELVKHHHDHNPSLKLSTNPKFQRRTIQTVVSVSIFSGLFVFLLSTFLVPLCFHSFKSFHVPAYFMELQSLLYTPSKKNMFFLCNGILMILLGSSGLIETGRSDGVAPSGPQAAHDDPRFSGHVHDISNELKEQSSMTKEEIPERGSELRITVVSHHDDDEIEDALSRDEPLITEHATPEQPRELMQITDGAVTDYNVDGNDDGADRELSVEELNRRCDEFIKRMKGEL